MIIPYLMIKKQQLMSMKPSLLAIGNQELKYQSMHEKIVTNRINGEGQVLIVCIPCFISSSFTNFRIDRYWNNGKSIAFPIIVVSLF